MKRLILTEEEKNSIKNLYGLNFINEQANPKSPIARIGAFGSGMDSESKTDVKQTPQRGPGLTRVRLYYDEANTKPWEVVSIDNYTREDSRNLVRLHDSVGYRLEFYCKKDPKTTQNEIDNNGQIWGLINGRSTTLYNKKYLAFLYKNFCTKSAGGTSVSDIGTFSSIDTNTPTEFV